MFSTTQRLLRPAHRPRNIALIVLAAFATAAAACTQTSLTEPDQSADKCQVTLTAPQAAIPGGGGTGSVAISATAECAWTASTSATWISNLTPASGQGAGNVQFTAAPNPARTTREANIDVNGALARVTQDPAVCTFTVAPTALSVSGGGGTGSVTVTTLTSCIWSAASQAPWITITSQADNNDGAGTVMFTAAPNPTGATRTGTIAVAGQTVSVTQTTVACGYSINPASFSVGNSGGTTSVAVTTTQACAWTAASNAPWITVTSGASGTGSGSVGLTIAANTGGTRSGTVGIAGQTFTVSQSADACAYTVAPLNQTLGETGGAATPITVTTASHCTWTAASNDAWLTIPSGTSGTGNGTVQVNVGANSGATRAGTLTIAGQTVTITQTAAGCSYNVSPLNRANVGVNGGAIDAVTVTTASHCTWTAVSNNAFIQVTSGASGTGNGTVQSTMSANTGASRTGTMAIAGSTVTVNQDACSYTLGASNVTIAAAGANNNTVSVTTNGTACAWTGSESESWIAITAGTTGSGSGQVTFNVDPNTGSARSGVITIAGQSFTVNQDALICNNSINPTSETVSVSAGTGTSIAVTTSVQACPWTAVSNDPSWITVTSGTPGTGNGTVGWTFGGNTSASGRNGTMTIAGQTFTAMQPGCTYPLSATSLTISNAGGSGQTVNVTPNGTACQWTASESESWLNIDSGASGTGNGTVSFTVDANMTMAPRSGVMTIAGQTFTVNQDP